jgi:hypothetical protein
MSEPSNGFRDLVVWQKAHAWVLAVYAATRSFSKEELFGLTSQLRRAASSVPANIVEGYRRRSKADKHRFFNITPSVPRRSHIFPRPRARPELRSHIHSAIASG